MHVPFGIGAEQQLQPLPWIHSNGSQHVVLPEDTNLLPQRDVECSASSSFGSYSAYFGPVRNSEMSNSGQESGILNEIGATASLRAQLGFPHLPYNLNMLSDMKFQPAAEMNLQQSAVEYPVNDSFEASRLPTILHTVVGPSHLGLVLSPCLMSAYIQRNDKSVVGFAKSFLLAFVEGGVTKMAAKILPPPSSPL
ncbi:MADS-box family protein [Tripterygium wilfordii]|uniref:MADS-box family protein n=1 Tax=Tripterygium wilfordii TaxID=458696 RepID=A0A7J7DGI7_TRIWF|nr:MADS-box family protein [Tripterygium wilfordii]